MCGIVGITSIESSGIEILNSLQRLEYRGYDSSGIAMIDQSGELVVKKRAGPIANIIQSSKLLKGPTGIRHTRWATHGVPNENNAHPHTNDEFAIVHNGIIENYFALSSQIPNFKPKTDTDSEIILKIIEEEYRKVDCFREALLKVARKLKGSFSVVIMHKCQPGKLYAMKCSLPLLVGRSKSTSYVVSDVVGLPKICHSMASLPDGSVSEISDDGFSCWDFSGIPQKVEFLKFQTTEENLGKSGFKHYMLKEIFEQHSILMKILSTRVNSKRLEIAESNGVQGLNLGKINHIQIVACGTAFHAGLIGKHYLEEFTRLPVTVELASKLRYSNRILSPKTLFVAISQSGETADTISRVAMARSAGCQVVSFCNRDQAEIPRLASKNIPLACGTEVSVASTKAFTSMLVSFYLFALSCGRNRGLLKRDLFARKLQNLEKLPELINAVLLKKDRICGVAETLRHAKAVFFIGRRNSYPIALEAALKLKEISYMHSEGYAGGELKHGPLALIEKDTPVICLAPNDSTYCKTLSNIIETKSRLARVISITNKSQQELVDLSDEIIEIPFVDEDLSPILTTVVVQLIAYFVADKLGRDIDKPRNLAKSVTVE